MRIFIKGFELVKEMSGSFRFEDCIGFYKDWGRGSVLGRE